MYPQAAVVAIYQNGSFLFIVRARREGDPWSGNIAFPGGFIKPHESSREAAARECYEEVGIFPEITASLGVFASNINNTSVEAFLAGGDIVKAKVNSQEVSSLLIAPVLQLTYRDDCYIYEGHRIWGLTFRITNSAIGALKGSGTI
ncbi:MAG: NUDIX domain-containing protein [Candidatus Thermoplasmatota archaeon]|nr:NUDIX domain-containing protein [Candidatus Thermoplasmatota archaeon]MCL5730669.1 NUDIX domain-containing protein [Candidatus Thermoplasmatota archaeon]